MKLTITVLHLDNNNRLHETNNTSFRQYCMKLTITVLHLDNNNRLHETNNNCTSFRQ